MPDSFDAYVVGRGRMLLRFAYLLTGDRYLAEDLVQDVLARAHRHWARIERLHQPDSYLRKGVLNQYLSWRRRRSSTEQSVADVPEHHRPGQLDHAAPFAERDELWRTLATLPRQQRAVLVLRYYEDLPDEEIGELLGCSSATVRSHTSRALARLRTTEFAKNVLAGGTS